MKIVKTKAGKFSVQYLSAEGKRKSTTLPVTTKKEAEALVKELKIKEMEDVAKKDILTQEVFNKLQDKNISVKQVTKEYLMHMKKASRSLSTINSGSAIFDQFIRDYKSGRVGINKVSDDDLFDFLNRDDGTSLANRKLRRTFFKGLFDYCVAKGYAPRNPVGAIGIDKSLLKHKQKEPKEKKPITIHEYRAIMQYADPFQEAITALSFWTGLRLSDCCSLEWASLSKDKMVIWTIKRDKRVEIPVGHELFGGRELPYILSKIEVTDKYYCFPEMHREAQDQKLRSKRSTYYKRLLEKVSEYEGLPELADKSFHCLRHSFVTRLKRAGKTLEEIGKIVGHGDTKTTEGYVHD